ncbi:unnamed protein product [Caenorhabditis angaria]|uniref:Uncharacterized protein n=1 Tax=Caenorhabditis angaria TaxID=860376 RepID=A0A9P1IN54_9PELO|nr:unnamed protein product [Caenorhabditis angaria]
MPRLSRRQIAGINNCRKSQAGKLEKDNQRMRIRIEVLENLENDREQLAKCEEELRNAALQLKNVTEELQKSMEIRQNLGDIIKQLELDLENEKLLRLKIRRECAKKSRGF